MSEILPPKGSFLYHMIPQTLTVGGRYEERGRMMEMSTGGGVTCCHGLADWGGTGGSESCSLCQVSGAGGHLLSGCYTQVAEGGMWPLGTSGPGRSYLHVQPSPPGSLEVTVIESRTLWELASSYILSGTKLLIAH